MLPSLPTLDWSWPIDHPRPAVVIFVVWATVITLLVVIWSRRVRDFKEQIRHGFAILYTPRPLPLARRVVAGAVLGLSHREHLVLPRRVRHPELGAERHARARRPEPVHAPARSRPAGLGTQQGFLLYAFRDSSIPHTELVAFSVGMQLATNAFNFVVGLIALLLIARTVRWKQIIAPERAEIDRARSER